MIRVLNVLLMGLILLRLLLVRGIPFQREEFLLLAFSVVAYFFILLLYETQPRFDIFLLVPGSYMAAQALGSMTSRGGRQGPIPGPRERYAIGAEVGLLLGIGAVVALTLKMVDGSDSGLSDMGTARALTATEIEALRPDVTPIQGKAGVTFNHADVGFVPQEFGILRGSAVGLGSELPVESRNGSLLEGFLLLAPGSVTHEEDLSGMGLEACLFGEAQVPQCGPLGDGDARFLQIPVRDLDGDGQVDLWLIVLANDPIAGERVPTHPVASLEHLRLR